MILTLVVVYDLVNDFTGARKNENVSGTLRLGFSNVLTFKQKFLQNIEPRLRKNNKESRLSLFYIS